jgi:glutamyl-tRNA(Gln) amidotransferase subunit D
MINVGDYIEIETSSEKIKGILMPNSINNKLVLKLENGYNIGIDSKKIKSKKLIKKKTKMNIKISKIKMNKKLPKISILHTGGTIASKVSYETGGVTAKFKPEELLEMFPKIKKIANITSRLIGNMFSEDMNFSHYNLIAKEIEKEVKKGVKGIIITHGTDTMHYTSAALSFILEDLNIPIILTGAQRSSDRPSSDAELNLICATQFISNCNNFADVGICMHSGIDDSSCYILPGTKTKKLHSSRRDAFQVINSKPWAKVDNRGKINYISTNFNKNKEKSLKLKLLNENLKIGILKTHPNLSKEEISIYSKFDGLIIEGTGLGHLGINKIDKFTSKNETIFNEIKKLSKKIPIIMCSQTNFGRVNMNVYGTGRKLQEFIHSGSDMTSETTFIKLAWLLSNKKNVKKLITKNLRGEINSRIKEEFL